MMVARLFLRFSAWTRMKKGASVEVRRTQDIRHTLHFAVMLGPWKRCMQRNNKVMGLFFIELLRHYRLQRKCSIFKRRSTIEVLSPSKSHNIFFLLPLVKNVQSRVKQNAIAKRKYIQLLDSLFDRYNHQILPKNQRDEGAGNLAMMSELKQVFVEKYIEKRFAEFSEQFTAYRESLRGQTKATALRSMFAQAMLSTRIIKEPEPEIAFLTGKKKAKPSTRKDRRGLDLPEEVVLKCPVLYKLPDLHEMRKFLVDFCFKE